MNWYLMNLNVIDGNDHAWDCRIIIPFIIYFTIVVKELISIDDNETLGNCNIFTIDLMLTGIQGNKKSIC